MPRPAVPLPLPPTYDPRHAADYGFAPYAAALATSATARRPQHAVRPAAADETRVHLLLIDVQKDFCFPEGSLYVAGRSGTGAIDDSRRIAELVYRNLGVITDITTTLDTHLAYQIFFPSFWLDRADAPLTAHRVITADQIAAGEVRPHPAIAKWLCGGNYPWLCKQVLHYARELERAGKYQLYLWPPHCLLGSDGHALAGVIHEARLFHAFARTAQSNVEVKGGNPLTENYSVLRPEVLSRFDGAALAQRNTGFLQTLLAADAVVAGQCPARGQRVHPVTVGWSAVTVPHGRGGLAADFTDQADQALARFANAGMHLVRSTDPLTSWPGIRL